MMVMVVCVYGGGGAVGKRNRFRFCLGLLDALGEPVICTPPSSLHFSLSLYGVVSIFKHVEMMMMTIFSIIECELYVVTLNKSR